MKKRISLGELRQGLQMIVEGEEKFAQSCEGDTNPQVTAMACSAKARAGMAEAVLRALDGDSIEFNIYVEGAKRKSA